MDHETDTEQVTEESGYGYPEGYDAGGGLDGGGYGVGYADHSWEAANLATAPPMVDAFTDTTQDLPSWVTEPILQEAAKSFTAEVEILANTWYASAGVALAGAPEPEEEESKAGWWLALAGNVLWAAACFATDGAAFTISLGGIGVGAAGGAIHGDKPPSGKELAGHALAQAHGALLQRAQGAIGEAAEFCAYHQISDPEKQKEMLWYRMFRTPFRDSAAMEEAINGAIKAGLAEYREQWKEWHHALLEEVAKRGGLFNPDRVEEIKHEMPFQPHLSFEA